VDFGLKIFLSAALLLVGSTHLCFKLLIENKLLLQFPLSSAYGDIFGAANVLDSDAVQVTCQQIL